MFITFEGPEGAGKSSLIKRVAETLIARGVNAVTTREPGWGDLGGSIRALLLQGEAVDPEAELFLFLADRANHLRQFVSPSLAEGKTVLCDRHSDSTIAYQCFGRGLDRLQVESAIRLAVGHTTPRMTLLLDLPVEIGLERLSNPDRLDREPREFHQRVRTGFLTLARENPSRIMIIDATQTQDEVFAAAMKYLV